MSLIKYKGNRKLRVGGVAYLSMPADPKVCGRMCKDCYAKRVFPVVQKYRWENYRLSLNVRKFESQLASELTELLAHGKIKALRIHDSGEFHSQAYVARGNWPALREYRES